MIRMSPAAIKEVYRLGQRQKAALRLRLDITTGGCADWLYAVSFAPDQPQPDDLVYTVQDIEILVTASKLPYLDDLAIDYSEDLMGGGFRFDNPNALQHCGCGYSFTLRAAVT